MLLRRARSQLILIGQDSSHELGKIHAVCFTNNKTVNHHKKKNKRQSEEREVHRCWERRTGSASLPVDVGIRACSSVTSSQMAWRRTDGWADGLMDRWINGRMGRLDSPLGVDCKTATSPLPFPDIFLKMSLSFQVFPDTLVLVAKFI